MTGFCGCGCGERPSLHDRGEKKGQPRDYCRGHNGRDPQVPTCGYVVNAFTGCWEWMRGKDSGGYGQTARTKPSGNRVAHRVIWEKLRGPIPLGMQLDHLCSNRACVNPDHLEVVTPAENVRRSRASKLDLATAARVRADPRPQVVIAREVGVHQSTISLIKSGKAWAA